MATEPTEDKLWQATYSARQSYIEAAVGPLPKDILKMQNMTGVWPGGGLFVVPAPRLGKHLAVYTTFGLSNSDMPTRVRMTNFQASSNGNRAGTAQGQLERKEPAQKRDGAAGYGYEIIVVSAEAQTWPIGFLQWAVNAEIAGDVGLLGRVEKYDGLTVERINVGPGGPINVLISKARPPLPVGSQLPDGKMNVLVATTITDEEMRWSNVHGRGALLQKLVEAGVGQLSSIGRPSVVR